MIEVARALHHSRTMNHGESIEAPAGAEERLLHVSRVQFLGSLAASIAIFVFVTGPLWRHAGDIGVLDWAILWSYCAVPLLVAGCLIASRRWSLRGFLLDTLALTLTKYVVTSTIGFVLWATVAPPQGAAPPVVRHPVPAAPEPALAPTRIDPARTGTVRATVVDASGRPLAGALVFIAGGLEEYVFAPPAEPLVLEHGPTGITPALAVVAVDQPLEARSTDGRMHTLMASRGGEVLFNVPLLASGAPTTVRMRDAHGTTALRCNVHPGEGLSRLLVVAHPFFGRSDAAGRMQLSGVPAGRLRMGAAYGDVGVGEAPVEVRAKETAEVRVVVAP